MFLHEFDTTLTYFVTSLPAWSEPFFVCITTLGSPSATISIGALMVAIGYFYRRSMVCVSGTLIWIALLLSSIIKLIVDRTRPVTDYAVQLQSSSFPSGHTVGATVAYGLLAYFAWQLPHPWRYVVSTLLVCTGILVGVSRIYLGAHFPSDVMAGWLLGAVVLFFGILAIRSRI